MRKSKKSRRKEENRKLMKKFHVVFMLIMLYVTVVFTGLNVEKVEAKEIALTINSEIFSANSISGLPKNEQQLLYKDNSILNSLPKIYTPRVLEDITYRAEKWGPDNGYSGIGKWMKSNGYLMFFNATVSRVFAGYDFHEKYPTLEQIFDENVKEDLIDRIKSTTGTQAQYINEMVDLVENNVPVVGIVSSSAPSHIQGQGQIIYTVDDLPFEPGGDLHDLNLDGVNVPKGSYFIEILWAVNVQGSLKETTADAVPVEKPFGYENGGTNRVWYPTQSELKNWVTRVLVNGYSTSNYRVELLSSEGIDTGKIGTKNYEVLVTADESGASPVTVNVPVTITGVSIESNQGDDARFPVGTLEKDADIKDYFKDKVKIFNEDRQEITGWSMDDLTFTIKNPTWTSVNNKVGNNNFTVEVSYSNKNGELYDNFTSNARDTTTTWPVEFYQDKMAQDIEVHYYLKGTTTSIKDSYTITAKDKQIGDPWTADREVSFTKEGMVYTLDSATLDGKAVSGTEPLAKGEFTDEKQIVNYYYNAEAAQGGTVTVNYYKNGTTTKLADSKILNGKINESWTADRLTSLTKDGITYSLDSTATIDGKNVNSTPVISGQFTANTQTVNYYYNEPVEEPLKIEFTKYQEDGKTPLAGAKFVMQRQLESSGKWALMSPAAANGNVVFTTNAQGKIIISESENTAFWNSMRNYGGNSENKQFRFREISAPSGYEQPPGYDVSNPMQESDSDSALAPFVTKAFFVDKNTTGTIDQPLTNKKAKLIVALHKVNESGQSLPGAVLVLQSQKRTEQNNWSTVVTAGLTTADVTFTTDSNGYAYLPEKLIDNMRTYGKDYEYRFREITAPSGYATPPAYSGGKEADGSPAGFISEVFQVDSTTTTNKTIEVVNYKSVQPQQGGDVTVNYYKKGTTTKLADSVTLKGKVGEEWQSTRNTTITKDGVTYTLDGVATLDGMDVSSDPALKGTFTANQRTVNYYYTEPATPTTPGDITINYYQDGTYVDKRVIEGSKFGLGAEVGIPKLPADQSGWSDYEFQKVVIGSNTYTDWSKVPMVTITTSNQTVSVYYVKKTVQPGGAVTVNYYQKGTTTKLANSVTLTGNIGENWVSTRPETIVKDGVTYELEEAAQLDGIDVASSPALSLPFIAASRTLNYYYSAKEAPAGGDVTVNYYEKGTTTKLAESVTLKGKVDESWQSTRNTTITKDGVQYTLDAIATFDGMDVSSDPAVSGIFDANQRTVNYYYNKVVVEEPLKIVFTKYAEDGKTPLAGAKFVMQRQLSNDNWALMNPAAANGEVVFTTNAQGQIIISNTENKAFWDSMKLYGGNVSNRNFRFREISAPSGYQQPPTYNVESPVEETNTAENLKGFVTEAFYVDSKTTGPINQSLVNKKESATPGKITVYYYQDDQYVEGSKRELTGFNIGSEVDIPKPLVGDFSNYEFSHAYVNYTTNKETTWPFTVTVTSEDQTVWVYYEKKVVTPTAAPINVYYYIQGTTTSVNDMISFVPLKPIGDLVEAEAKTSYTYQGDTYKLVSYKVDNGIVTSTSNPIKVEVKSTAQTVVYYYEKQEVGTVNSIKVIKYDDSTPRKPLKGAKFSLQWRSSGSSLWTGIGLGFESDENGVAEVPAEYVQSVNTLEGQWKIVETDPPTGFEKVGNGETEIFTRNSGTDLQFEMVNKRKDGGKVTVNYFIENTETPLVTSKTLTGKYEEEWTAARETVITKDGIEYTLKSAVFNNNPVADVNTPVSGKFTLNAQTVTYYYESEDLGDIMWNVPTTMDFGEVTVPLMKDLDQYLIQDAQKPWQIQVEDERKNRDPWRISARLEKEFVSKTNGQTLSSILKFKEGSVDQTLTTTAPVEIYQSKTQPDVLTTIDWQSPNGFYLGLKALGSYPVGEANATVEFVLITEP